MKYLHIIAAVVAALLAYPVYLRHGEWWALVDVLGVVGNLIYFFVEDKK